jgi:hypothetical protein
LRSLKTRVTGTLIAIGLLVGVYTVWDPQEDLDRDNVKVITLAWQSNVPRQAFITWTLNSRGNTARTDQTQWARIIDGRTGDHVALIVETNLVFKGSCAVWVNGVKKAETTARAHDCRVSYVVQHRD